MIQECFHIQELKQFVSMTNSFYRLRNIAYVVFALHCKNVMSGFGCQGLAVSCVEFPLKQLYNMQS